MADPGLVTLFMSCGLSESKAIDTIKNEGITKNLKAAIAEAHVHLKKNEPISRQTGVLLYHVATKIKPKVKPFIPILSEYVCTGKINTETRLNAAIEYLTQNPKEPVDLAALGEASGVGVVITPEMVEKAVEEVIGQYREELESKRYHFPQMTLISKARQKLRFADGRDIVNEVEVQLLDLLGPKTAADHEKPKVVKVKPVTVKETSSEDSDQQFTAVFASGAMTIGELMKTKVHFHKPGDNYKTDGYVTNETTMHRLEEHLKATGGQVRTRFPPEPNGILHIGHAKAININFGYAMAHGGICFLRYDDTNPEKEEERFFVAIKELVTWLGYTPFEIRHSSDYFDQLYLWGVELIKRGHAYVCHQPAEALKGHRAKPSAWRDRPMDESLQLFEDMKNGKIDEGKATLRMKMTMEEGKQDPVAYRIKFVPHPRTGDKWCIYPTYDYAHCLCDSIENITHSLCTSEFRSRRSSYYWLCNAVDVYCPVQWEYGRLNMEYTVVSKRKIGKLISEGIVRDWDDPRLFTLSALRRRGFPPEAINNFCAKIGAATINATVEPPMLEFCVREVLQVTAPRTMVVLDPIKVTLTDCPADIPAELDVPDYPPEPQRGSHRVSFRNVVYIERADFREMADGNFRRLTTSQPVGLKYVGVVASVTKVTKNADGLVSALEASCYKVGDGPHPKAFVHWVAAPVEVEIRLYERLFKHRNPEDGKKVPGGFITDCNMDSLKVIPKALVDGHLSKAKVYDKFQFERTGYFSVDPDSMIGKLVFNRTVQLKEDPGKRNDS